MKLKKMITYILTATIFLSCANQDYKLEYKRAIASIDTTPISLMELMTFYASDKEALGKENFFKKLKLNLTSDVVNIVFKENKLLPSDIAFQMVPGIDEKTYFIEIHYSPNSLFDDKAFREISSFFHNLTQEHYRSAHSFFEIYYNAKNNSIPALHTLTKLRNFSAVDFEKKAYWHKKLKSFDELEKKLKKETKEKTELRKLIMNRLDNLSDDGQFRILVSKNDRKGVSELLDSYLPWELMPPFETKFWQHQLEMIKNPLPLDQRIMIYRGLDDDDVQVGFEALKKATKEEAIKNQNVFFFSSILTKNQGTWNRRLRSLSAMYEKYIGIDQIHDTSEFSRVSRITNMLYNHSINPQGSPFLSFTPNIKVANTFGFERIAAFFIDPRALYFNYSSEFAVEKEFLMPLITFPDELAGIFDSSVHDLGKNVRDNERLKFISNHLKQESLTKLSHVYGKGEAPEVYKKIEKNSNQYFGFFIGLDVKKQKMGVNIDEIYKKELGKNLIKSITPLDSENNNCTVLIKNFL